MTIIHFDRSPVVAANKAPEQPHFAGAAGQSMIDRVVTVD